MPHKQIHFVRALENQSFPLPDFGTYAIDDRKRATMIDWVISIHDRFMELKQETLHICVTIIDRILALNKTPDDHLWLLGLTSLFIATKFEDIH